MTSTNQKITGKKFKVCIICRHSEEHKSLPRSVEKWELCLKQENEVNTAPSKGQNSGLEKLSLSIRRQGFPNYIVEAIKSLLRLHS